MSMTKKTLTLLFILAALAITSACNKGTEERETYELKIYRFETAEQESRLDKFLEQAYLPALHRAGIKQVGVFKLRENENDMENAIFMLIPFRNPGQYEALAGDLKNDQLYLDTGRDYLESPHDNPPFTRIESMIIKAFTQFPQLKVPELDSPRPERVYELRSYESATELLHERKVEMFNTGESALFEKLGFNPVFFGQVIVSAHLPHLMYMTTFADTTSQKEHWDAFRNHPEWGEMKEIERFKNTVSKIDRYLLYPTSYSDY